MKLFSELVRKLQSQLFSRTFKQPSHVNTNISGGLLRSFAAEPGSCERLSSVDRVSKKNARAAMGPGASSSLIKGRSRPRYGHFPQPLMTFSRSSTLIVPL